MVEVENGVNNYARDGYTIAGLIIDTLKNSKVFIIGEFNARLHPLISH
jgi:hypothetical protein